MKIVLVLSVIRMDVKISWNIKIKTNQSINIFIDKNTVMKKPAFCEGLPAKCFKGFTYFAMCC